MKGGPRLDQAIAGEGRAEPAAAPAMPAPAGSQRPLIGLVLAACVLLGFPVLAVVEAVRAEGWPFATALYLFCVWALLIALAALALERRGA